MANNGVSMNIAVFKELNDQLQEVSQGTDLFRNRISGLMKDLQGLSQVVSSIPAGLNNLNKQMSQAGNAASFNANNVVSEVQKQNIPSYMTEQTFQRPPAENLPIQINTTNGKSPASNFLAQLGNNNVVQPQPPVQNNTNYNAPQPQPTVPYLARQYQTPRYDDFQKMVNIDKLQTPESKAKASEQIDNLTKGLSSVDKTIAKVLSKELSDLKKEFSDGSDMFKKYNESLTKFEQLKAGGAKEELLEKAAKELSDAAATIKDSAGKLADVSKASEQLISEQPTAKKGLGVATKVAMGLEAAAFVAHTAATVTRQGFDFYKDMEARDITSGRETLTGRGALAQKQFGMVGEQFNMYNARNLMRWGGDLMAPNLMQYAGQEGYGKAKNKSFEELAREQQLKQTEMKTNLVAGGLETGGSLLKAIAAPALVGAAAGSIIPGLGTAVGAGAGAIAGIASLFMVGNAVKDAAISANKMATQYAAAPAQEITGGRANSWYGQMANWAFGTQENTADIANRTRDRVAVEQANQFRDRARAYQDAEIERLPFVEQGVQKYQDIKQARQQALSQLGKFAGLPFGELSAESRNQVANIIEPTAAATKKQVSQYLANTPGAIENLTGAKLQEIQSDARIKGAEASVTDVIAKEMTRDARGNFASPSMKFANMGLGLSEVQQRAYQYQQSLGIGQMKTTEQAVNDSAFNRLNRMSLAGVGSFEQLTGNVTALSQISGGSTRNNEKQLETILAKGVEAGFNSSRLSQSLVQTTTEIAAGLNLRNVSGVATTVLDTARVIGGGKADERTMKDAAASIQQYAQFTGQKEGPMGMLNMANALRAGFTPGKGLSTALNMNEMQVKDMQQRIQQLGGLEAAKRIAETDPSKIPDFEMRFLLKNNPEALGKLIETKKEVGLNVFSGGWKATGQQGTLEDARAKFIKDMDSAKTQKEKSKITEDFTMKLTAAGEYAGKANLIPAVIAETLSETKAGQAENKQRFLKTESSRRLVDAEKQQQAGFETVMGRLGKEFAGHTLNANQYVQALSAGKMTTTIDGKQYTGEQLQKEMAERKAKGDNSFEEKVKERAQEETVSSMAAKRASVSNDLSAPPSKTNITGIELAAATTLAQAIAKEMRTQPANPSTPVFGANR